MWVSIAGALHVTPEEDKTVARPQASQGPQYRQRAQPQASSVAQAVADSFNTGRQLCNGNSPGTINEKVVALMMVGQPFHSKDFSRKLRRSCDSLSMEVQRMLANNHITNFIKPLEADGFRVDIFLAESSCRASVYGGGRLTEWIDNGAAEETRVRYSEELKIMYGIHRVVSTVSMDTAQDQFYHVGQMMEHVRKHTVDQGSGYRFLIVMRYDLKLLFNLADVFSSTKNAMTNATIPSSPDLALNSFVHGVDFLFMFPGGLANCMNQLFNDCLAASDEAERNPKCYRFGPLVLDHYKPRFDGYINALGAVRKALTRLNPGYAAGAQVGPEFVWKDGAEHCQYWCRSLEETVISGYYPAYMTLKF